MSDLKPSKIKCKSCGYEPNIIADVCIKCGGEIVKICGNCEHENSVEKNRCDNCGELLALTPHKKIDIELKEKERSREEELKDRLDKQKVDFKIEFESITDTIARKEESYRKKLEFPKQTEEKKDIIKEELKKVEVEKKKIEEFVKEKKNSENTQNQQEKHQTKKTSLKLIAVVIASLTIILSISYLIFGRKSFSRYDLIITAKKYLSALRDGEYDKAYEFLSQNSKAIISFSNYVKTLENYYSNVGKWNFKDIEIYYFDKNQSIIKYRLIENNIEKDDYLNFIMEYGKWKRPFVFNLFEEIDDAFLKKDFPRALFLAQRAYLIDPVDPRTSGYLCWSEYLMGLHDKSVESCKRVVEISNIYPIKYYSESELFWYSFNYADSLRFTEKIEQSIEVYNALQRNPSITEREKCVIHVARSDSYIALKDYNSALNDIKKAMEVCENDSIEKKEMERRFKILTGEMCEDAIMFAKKYKYGGLTLESYLNQNFDLTGTNYNTKFSCSYLKGSVYNVYLEMLIGKRILKRLNIEVDLWNKTATMKEVK